MNCPILTSNCDVNYVNRTFHGFQDFLQRNARLYIDMDDGCFFPSPFYFTKYDLFVVNTRHHVQAASDVAMLLDNPQYIHRRCAKDHSKDFTLRG